MEIDDPERAARYLKHIGYFRLSPYTIPFQVDGHEHRFRTDVAFDDVLDLYVFDRVLRLLIIDALERVEVAVRAALTDHMSTTYDDPHWYVDPEHFSDRGKHSGLLDIVEKTCDNRLRGNPDTGDGGLIHRSALEHYLLTYGTPKLPPSWLMVENIDDRPAGHRHREPAASFGPNGDRSHDRDHRTDPQVVAAHLCPRSKCVRPSWAPLEHRTRGVPRDPLVTGSGLAKRAGRPSPTIREAALSSAGIASIRARHDLASQQLGSPVTRVAQRSAADEPYRDGSTR
jgi:hypothetical protein